MPEPPTKTESRTSWPTWPTHARRSNKSRNNRARASEGCGGAELEQVVVSALNTAFAADRPLTT
jgi:hypothetical protein